jgi:hypothetical protein
MKTQLTPMDIDRLNAARGLDLKCSLENRLNANRSGLQPSRRGLQQGGLYTGRLIVPIGSEDTDTDL